MNIERVFPTGASQPHRRMSHRLNVTPTRPRGPRNHSAGGESQLRERTEFASRARRSNPPCDRILHALADPTRRLIFELLSSGGELTVRELIKHTSVTQQAVAQHLSLLQLAGVVTVHRKVGTRNYYGVRPSGGAPLVSWLEDQGILPTNKQTAQPRASNANEEFTTAYAHARAEYVASISQAIAALKEACNRADAEFLAASQKANDRCKAASGRRLP
jgi:DNA-binding transcriptional ArsR family regulator